MSSKVYIFNIFNILFMSNIMKSFTLNEETVFLLSGVSGPGKTFTNASAATRHAIKYAFHDCDLDLETLNMLSGICGPGKQYPTIAAAMRHAVKTTFGGN